MSVKMHAARVISHRFVADVLLIKLKVLQVTTGQQKASAVGCIPTEVPKSDPEIKKQLSNS